MNKPSKNIAILNDFIQYCIAHPEVRFWQALRNWANVSYIYFIDSKDDVLKGQDTFYFEGKDK